MNQVEVIHADISRARLTLTPTRTTLKVPLDCPDEFTFRMFAKGISKLMSGKVIHGMRGRFSPTGTYVQLWSTHNLHRISFHFCPETNTVVQGESKWLEN